MRVLLGGLVGLLVAGTALAQEKAPTQKEIKEICDYVAKCRGMEFKHDVPAGVKTVDDFRQMMKAEMAKSMPEEKLLGVQKSMAKLGLIPGDLQLNKMLVEFYSQAVAAYYDPETKQLFVLDRTEVKDKSPMAAMNDMFMKMIGVKEGLMYCAHELTHALQDQYFDLSTMPMDLEDDDDEVTAVKSLCEGEANLVMYEYLGEKMNMDADGFFEMSQGQLFSSDQQTGSALVDKAPAILREGAMFPYTVGLKFVHEVRKAGGWDAVSKVYGDLPASTEQIIHPEKYLGEERDYPQTVTLPDLGSQLKGWKELSHNVIGEFQMQVMFRTVMPGTKKKSVASVCAGWDGDLYRVYEREKDGRVMLVWASTWDTEEDAKDFFGGYKKLLAKKYGELTEVESNDTLYVADTEDEGRLGLERRGSDVLVIEGCDGDQGQALGKAIWAGMTKKEVRKVERVVPKETAHADEGKTPKVTPKHDGGKKPAHGIRVADGDLAVVLPRLPKGWSKEAEGASCDLVGAEEPTVVRVMVVKGDAKVADVLNKAVEKLQAKLEDAKTVGRAKDVEHESLSGREQTLENGDYRVRIVVLAAEGGTVTLKLVSDPEHWKADNTTFQEILDGLSID